MKREDTEALLRVAPPEMPDMPHPFDVQAGDPARDRGLSGSTVMMVDDEPMMTEVVQTYLEEAGYTDLIATNDPVEALEMARATRPGVILLDLMMPGMSGFDVLQAIRADEDLRYTPVIVLTAASNAATKLRALELGATEFLSKPVDKSELMLRVRNSLAFKVYQDRLVNDDVLTGLPNRKAFVSRLETRLADAQRGERQFGLLHIALDRFKLVNDTLGHAAGDQLLKLVAERLASCIRRGENEDGAPTLLGRMGGDEFTLMLPNLEQAQHAARVAQRVLVEMARPFEAGGVELFITPSIGIAVFPQDGGDAQTLLQNADLAMHHAKAGGRNTFEFYESKQNTLSRERLTLENHLHRAIARNELVLYYQPKVCVKTGQLVGAEALLRWFHPELGLIPPDRFIPIAEESGLIVPIGEWVMDTACAQLAKWRAEGQPHIKLAINVSRHEMAHGGLFESIRRALARHGVPAQQIVIELTESVLMDRVDLIVAQLHAMRAIGLEVSIDDFGTGYSSMAYLKRFPIDELKIDRSFIKGTPDDKTDVAIVRALIVLAQSLAMRVVAEGVETPFQHALLRQLGCDVYQGYMCSPPVNADKFMEIALRIGCTA
ncbi:MAG: diguanylate cyclase protein [Rhizobacter sp.]|nr:diguanylate cyclase protein [Rhizobacter sp.]